MCFVSSSCLVALVVVIITFQRSSFIFTCGPNLSYLSAMSAILPSSWSMDVNHAQLAQKTVKLLRSQRPSENAGNLFDCGHMSNFD